jgi:hypothetical protein
MSVLDWWYGEGTSEMIDTFLKGDMGSQIQGFYEPRREELLETKKVVENLGSGNVVNHVLSLGAGCVIEYNTYRKKFSYLRAGMYYFATYSFTAAWFLNDLVAFSGNRFAAGIDTLEAEYQKKHPSDKAEV